MKKLFIFAAIAAAALSSCSSDELVQAEQPVVEDGAVSFSAYTGRANRATEMKDAELGEYGFGVFAYEQGNTAWDTYRAGNTYPNFMYNQKVGQKVTTASKYAFDGDKNITTLAQYVNASAYIKSLYTTAPQLEAKGDASTFTDAQQEVLKTSYNWKNGSGDFTVASQKITYAQYEALTGTLWANKASLFAINGTLSVPPTELKPAEYNALPAADQYHFKYTAPVVTGDWEYHPIKYFSNNVDAKHSFFAYAPYQQDVKAVFSDNGPAVRYNAADDYDLLWGKNAASNLAWYDTKKQGVTDNINLHFEHALSKVSFEATYFVDKIHGETAHGATGNFLDEDTKVVIRSVKFVGQVPSQGLLSLYDGTWKYEKIEESACEMMTGTTFIWDQTDDKSGTYKPLKNNMMLIPTQVGDKVKIQIVYDVITTDVANPKNNSTVTNTITSEEAYELVQGKAYTFKLDLGLTSVKFTADVQNWDAEADTYVDMPNNLPYSLVSYIEVTTPTTGTPLTSGSNGDFAFDASDKKLYKYTTSWSQVTTNCPVVYYDSKYYVSTADNGTYVEVTETASSIDNLQTKASGYYILDGKLYKVVK